jgi:hypothetical protein
MAMKIDSKKLVGARHAVSIFEADEMAGAATVRGAKARNVNAADLAQPGRPQALHAFHPEFPPHFDDLAHSQKTVHVPMSEFHLIVAQMTPDSCPHTSRTECAAEIDVIPWDKWVNPQPSDGQIAAPLQSDNKCVRACFICRLELPEFEVPILPVR